MMQSSHILYLGSKSLSRQRLLQESQIPFVLVGQDADETACEWGTTLQSIVENIALHKMEHVVLPQGHDGEVRLVLTADTMSQDHQGTFGGKPIDRDDAIAKLKAARHGMCTGTGFCLDKKIWKDGSWQVVDRHLQYVEARYMFVVPDNWIDGYLARPLVSGCSQAIAIEGSGALFLQEVHGSYTTIVGLPMFELREALTKLGFFE